MLSKLYVKLSMPNKNPDNLDNPDDINDPNSTNKTNNFNNDCRIDEIDISSSSDEESNDEYNEKEIQEAMKEAYENVMKELSSQIRETEDYWNDLIEKLEKRQFKNDNSNSDTNDESQYGSNEENLEIVEEENEHIFRRRKRRRVDDQIDYITPSDENNDSYENSEVKDKAENKSLDDRYEESVLICLKVSVVFLLSIYIFSFYAMVLT